MVDPGNLDAIVLQTDRISRRMLFAMVCFGFKLEEAVFNHIYTRASHYRELDVIDLLSHCGKGLDWNRVRSATMSGRHELEPPS
jgi:hypothetical protein